MIKLLILSLLAVLTGLFFAIYLARDPGYVLIAYGNYTFETSLFALFMLALLVFLIYRMLMIFIGALNPGNWRSRKSSRS